MIVKHASVTPLSSRSRWKIMPTNTRSSFERLNAHAAVATRVPLMLLHFFSISRRLFIPHCVCAKVLTCSSGHVCVFVCCMCFFSFFMHFFVFTGMLFEISCDVFFLLCSFSFFFFSFCSVWCGVSCFGAAYSFFHVLQYSGVFYSQKKRIAKKIQWH